jgi:uncharacterized membrane protein
MFHGTIFHQKQQHDNIIVKFLEIMKYVFFICSTLILIFISGRYHFPDVIFSVLIGAIGFFAFLFRNWEFYKKSSVILLLGVTCIFTLSSLFSAQQNDIGMIDLLLLNNLPFNTDRLMTGFYVSFTLIIFVFLQWILSGKKE